MQKNNKILISVENSLKDISKKEWNNCANPNSNDYNPFVSYDFLRSLEESNSINSNSGWYSSYFIARDTANKIIGCIPSYLKNNSSGEYVFDYSWAEAYQRIGRSYYPKLQISIPFTPVTAPKLLTHKSKNQDVEKALLYGIENFCKNNSLSSAHLTFLTKKDLELIKHQGWLIRTDQQFHWHNDNYRDFEDFLDALSSRKRKNIRKERDEANKKGIEIEILNDSNITEHHWDHFYNFYLNTSMRKWGQPYLERKFFSLVGNTLSKDILLIMAKHNKKYIAGALNF